MKFLQFLIREKGYYGESNNTRKGEFVTHGWKGLFIFCKVCIGVSATAGCFSASFGGGCGFNPSQLNNKIPGSALRQTSGQA